MPEIAEVRVVAKTLKKELLGKKIKKVEVLYNGIIIGDVNKFKSSLEGLTYKDITTYGKWIIFNLGTKSILSHLRMEGKYFYISKDEPINKHDHVIITLDNNMTLRYNDVRKFGKMILVDTKDVFKTKEISKLGYEPDSKLLTKEYLFNKLNKLNIPIKVSLLDQTIINGLGNIYANEVLFASSINPTRKSNTISLDECDKIIKESKRIVLRSEELGGCTIRSYTSSLGVIGHYQDELKVHMQTICKTCDNKITRIKIDGRSTYYCTNCQK